MNKYLPYILLSVIILAIIDPEWVSGVFGDDEKMKRETLFQPVNEAFSPGEKLEFQVSWLGITAGKSYMSVGQPETLDDSIVWPLRSGAETSGLVKKLYKIDNKTVSYLDPLFCYPLRFEVDQYTAGREEKITINIMQIDHKVEWYRQYNTKESTGSEEIRRGIQDSLSSIYYLRNQILEVGKSIKIPVYASRKRWMLEASVLKKEKIKVPAGTFMTFKVKPIMLPESEGEPKGTMVLWLSDDQYHLPVQINSEVNIGSIVMKMTNYKLGTK